MDSITRIVQLLSEVRRRDRALRVFGAERHRYETRRVADAELAAFERNLGVALPAEYRVFLEEVGWGAGPYYGLWSPAESSRELVDLRDDATAAPSAARPFVLTSPADGGTDPIMAPYPTEGVVPIAHHGCTFWTLLVTAGGAPGTVWDVACYEGEEGEYIPSARAPGLLPTLTKFAALPTLPALPSPPTFLEWYEGWVTRCLTDLSPPRENVLRSWARRVIH